ncbi:FtsX-like permease family protein [Algoriphagus sp. NBT04N3]|uniref:ABC transporter permease n=1 Tax=Algoriphagus sp. NBT04N3 TaxID=2705473 RepID=UPI001C632770|nr:ABC transporter permease [Algoriphagus sp. NBT04N3]QYH39035.1 FtsX-like permease family protein [Algoriphagus sp. NBT04N3]
MLKNYLKIAWRTLLRQRIFSLINVLGLAIGLACFLLLASYVKFEQSYDSFQEDSDRIFRVSQQIRDFGNSAWAGGAVAPMLRKEFGEQLEEIVSLIQINTYLKSVDGINPEESFREDYFFYAEPGFENIAGLKVLQGSLKGAFDDPFSLVLTRSKAKHYFGDENPVGKVLLATGDIAFEVKAVVEDLPANTHMKFDFLSSVSTFKNLNNFPQNADFGSFWWPQTFTYVKVKEGQNAQAISDRIPEINGNYRDPEEAKNYQYYLQPIQSIHLQSGFGGEWTPGVDQKTLWIFLSIGGFVLLLACINFINLATARAIRRMKEIGVRKVNGAKRGQLMAQFLAEAFLTNAFALVLGLILVGLAQPIFTSMLGISFEVPLFSDNSLIGIVLAVWIISSLLAGVFPAFYLSGLRPDVILKNSQISGGKALLRKSLVVFQFALSSLLVFCAGVAYMQHTFLRTSDMGFDHQGLLTVKLGNAAKAQIELLKSSLEQQSGVISVNAISNAPGLEGGWNPSVAFRGVEIEEAFSIYVQYVDESYFENLGVEVIAGREFSPDFQDQGEVTEMMRGQFPKMENLGVVVNESAAAIIAQAGQETLGNAVRIYTDENGNLFSDYNGNIVGVVEDYHTQDLKTTIKPTVFLPVKNAAFDGSNILLIRTGNGFDEAQITQLKNAWNQIIPGIPFDYSFLDERIAQNYAQEARTGNLLGAFAILTLLISCLGLLGLSIFTAETKRKEIGIRKVLGASVQGIISQLSKEFIYPVILALLIAFPLGFYLMSQWLEQFATKVNISIGFFLATGMTSLVFAWLTVTWQSWKAATSNPVKSIKSE